MPEFGQKQDAVPGIVTTVVITPTKTGEYRLICTELCGLGHALMRTRAIVLSQADFAAWTKKQPQGGGSASGGEIDAKGIFTANCAPCHTLTKAGTNGMVGPVLDDLALPPPAVRAARSATAAAGCPRSETSSRMTRSKRSCSI